MRGARGQGLTSRRAHRRHGGLGLHLCPRPERGRGVPALRVSRRPLWDLGSVLAPFALAPLRRTPRFGILGGCVAGLLLALAYGLQTAGLELTTVSSTGFITGLYVLFTPLIALALLRDPGSCCALGGRGRARGAAASSGVPGGSVAGNLLVLGNALAQAFQIALIERFAPQYEPVALTFLQLVRALVSSSSHLTGELVWPDSGTVWYAVASGIFAGRSAIWSRRGCRRGRRRPVPRSSSRSRRRSPHSSASCSCTTGSAGSAGGLRRDARRDRARGAGGG